MHIPKLFEITDNSIIEKFINENGGKITPLREI